MKKRMLYISVYDPHVPYTGAGVRGGEFVTNLAKRFDIDLLYLEGSGHPGDKQLEAKFEWRVKGVVSQKRFPFSMKNYFIYSQQLLMAAEKLLAGKKYEVVLTDYGLSAYYGLKIQKQYRIPFVYCSHNIEYRQYLGKAKKDKRRYPLIPYVYWIESRGVKKCDLLVPISEQDADFYTRWKPRDQMHPVPQCFNEQIFDPFYEAPKNDPKIVLFFGNYNISTNRDAVYVAKDQVVDQVIAKYSNVKFQFIGANPPTDIQHPNMEFLGFVEHIEDYVKKCDVMISPILQGWGMPTKVIESLACGKPVIATEVASRAVPKKYRTLKVVEIGNFAEAIVAALKQDRPVDARDFELLKQEFTWAGAIAKLADRIEKMLQNPA
ncbi:glycosyltransferase family 4 protein [candidate division KSB1 bacterium]|nr:glycosyltransferase family 4 protein [candidate division KSB1 bacterium]